MCMGGLLGVMRMGGYLLGGWVGKLIGGQMVGLAFGWSFGWVGELGVVLAAG